MKAIFSTSRLLIRKLQFSDATQFYELQGNQKVMEFTSFRKAMNKEEAEADLRSVISKYDTPDNNLWVWAIVRKTDNSFVGTCALVHEGGRVYEIGYILLESEWGNGFGREVSDGLIDFAIDNWNAKEIIAFVDKKNIGSIKILERSKLNFIREFHNLETQTQDLEFRLQTKPQKTE